tara:strand:- start:62 stop:553 length:492 start_codon:yes stop_codon:yes gene_type:complete
MEMFDTIQTAAKKWSNDVTKSGASMSVLLDALIAEGATLESFKAPAKGEEANPTRKACDAGVLASYGVGAVKIQATTTKDLSDKDKATKRYNQQQVASRRAKIAKALDARLNPVDKGPTPRKADDKFLREWLALGVKRVETSDGAGDLDLVEMKEWLEDCPIK